mmetsp:Transcript_38009/g.104542  ORF Transcript_38009/g.104542 Transcript_38009/m.104542 type:complete len:207 (+) Transcript_38009:2266-2886(+)
MKWAFMLSLTEAGAEDTRPCKLATTVGMMPPRNFLADDGHRSSSRSSLSNTPSMYATVRCLPLELPQASAAFAIHCLPSFSSSSGSTACPAFWRCSRSPTSSHLCCSSSSVRLPSAATTSAPPSFGPQSDPRRFLALRFRLRSSDRDACATTSSHDPVLATFWHTSGVNSDEALLLQRRPMEGLRQSRGENVRPWVGPLQKLSGLA